MPVDAVGVTEDPRVVVLVAAEDPRVVVLVTPLAAEVVVAWVVVLVPPVAWVSEGCFVVVAVASDAVWRVEAVEAAEAAAVVVVEAPTDAASSFLAGGDCHGRHSHRPHRSNHSNSAMMSHSHHRRRRRTGVSPITVSVISFSMQ